MTSGRQGLVAFNYSVLIIKRMYETSQVVPATDLVIYGYPVRSDDEAVKVFIGHVTAVGKDVGVIASNVHHSMSLLNSMRCVERITTGGPNRPSIYILNYIPTEEQFQEFKLSRDGMSRRIAPNKYDRLIDEITALRGQVQNLIERVQSLEGTPRVR